MSDPNFWVNVLTRWLHVGAAVLGIGATLFMVLVLLPALAGSAQANEVLDRVRPRLKRVIHSAIGLLLLTGFYNYLVVSTPVLREDRYDGIRGMYHMLMGPKMLLAIILFTISILLLVPLPAMHAKRKMWLTVNAVLGVLILLISAVLRRLWTVGG